MSQQVSIGLFWSSSRRTNVSLHTSESHWQRLTGTSSAAWLCDHHEYGIQHKRQSLFHYKHLGRPEGWAHWRNVPPFWPTLERRQGQHHAWYSSGRPWLALLLDHIWVSDVPFLASTSSFFDIWSKLWGGFLLLGLYGVPLALPKVL